VTTNEPSPFIAVREFGRILFEAFTIYLALPLVCAHWAIVRGWAEPHYLTSFGLMPAGAVFADGGFAQVMFSRLFEVICVSD
jgi:hypothetical protein